MSPVRVQMTRRPGGWRADHPDAVIVARPSRWGNPYTVGTLIRDFAAECVRDGDDPVALRAFAPTVITRPDPPNWMITRTVQDRADAVQCFRHLMTELRFNDEDTFEEWLDPLVGRDLACWCPLEDAEGNRPACHADVLLEIANPDYGDPFVPCGRGICAAPAGHEGTCAQASGWTLPGVIQ